MLLVTAKSVAIFFGLATTAFLVSTVVLAGEKFNLEKELQDALDKLDIISSLITDGTTSRPIQPTSSTALPTPSTIQPPTTLEVNDSTSTMTTIQGHPSFPTLPSGLPDPEKITYRLPKDIRPIKYKLYIHPDFKSKTCEGFVSIQIEIDTKTNLIVLHAKNLEINSISILNMMAFMRLRVRNFYLDVGREMLFIELEEVLFTKTPYVVSISYNCQLDGLVGIYASSYLDAGHKER